MPTPGNLFYFSPDLISEMNEQQDLMAQDPELIIELFEEQLDDPDGEHDFDIFIQRSN